MKSVFLKVMAIICLVFGIIAAILGAVMLAMPSFITSLVANSSEAQLALDTAYMELAASSPESAEVINASGQTVLGVIGLGITIVAVVIIIEAIIMILSGIFGMRASNNVDKIAGAIVMGIITLVLGIIGFIMGAAGGTFSILNVVLLILPILYCVAAFMFKAKAGRAAKKAAKKAAKAE